MKSVTELIPAADWDAFHRLAQTEQDDVLARLNILAEMDWAIARGRSKQGAARDNARQDAFGFSHKRLQRLWRDWVKAGRRWTVAINKAKCANPDDVEIEIADAVERKQFLDVYGGYIQGHQRKNAPAYRAFLRDWFAGVRFPFYGTWSEYWAKQGQPHLRACPRRVLPKGWSASNLAILATPPKIELALARQGVSAALQLFPPIPGTREGVRPLEYVSFDDVKHDSRKFVSGYGAVELQMLASMCYACAKPLRFGLRPRLPSDEDKNRKEALRLADMTMLAAVQLMDFGWPADYVSYWILEHGTATLPEAKARALYELTGGKIVCVYSLIEGGMVLAWDDRAKGNSRAKSWHESWHNLFHNEAANLPGQTGKDREHAPAALQTMQREALSLDRAGTLMAPDQRRRFKMPFTTLEEAFYETAQIIERTCNRWDHRIEGFRPIVEWRHKGEIDWRSEEELEVWLASIGRTFEDVYPSLIELHPNPRFETPNERWRRLCRGVKFVKAPGWLVRRLLDYHVPVKIQRGAITFDYQRATHVFWPERIEDALPDYDQVKRTYLAWFVPHMAEFVFLTDESLGYVGRWRRMKVPRYSSEQLAEMIRRKTALLNQALSNVRRRDVARGERGLMAQRNEALDVNLRVLSDAGMIDQKTISDSQMDRAPADTSLDEGSGLGADRLGPEARETVSPEPITPDRGAQDCLTRLPARPTNFKAANRLNDEMQRARGALARAREKQELERRENSASAGALARMDFRNGLRSTSAATDVDGDDGTGELGIAAITAKFGGSQPIKEEDYGERTGRRREAGGPTQDG